MALIDKVKAQAAQLAQKAQEAGKAGQAKLEDVQARRRADAALHDLGAAYFAQHTGRATDQTNADIARLVSELSQYEAEHGPLSGDGAAGGATGDPETPEGGFTLDT
jgi:hypothetical protein